MLDHKDEYYLSGERFSSFTELALKMSGILVKIYDTWNEAFIGYKPITQDNSDVTQFDYKNYQLGSLVDIVNQLTSVNHNSVQALRRGDLAQTGTKTITFSLGGVNSTVNLSRRFNMWMVKPDQNMLVAALADAENNVISLGTLFGYLDNVAPGYILPVRNNGLQAVTRVRLVNDFRPWKIIMRLSDDNRERVFNTYVTRYASYTIAQKGVSALRTKLSDLVNTSAQTNRRSNSIPADLASDLGPKHVFTGVSAYLLSKYVRLKVAWDLDSINEINHINFFTALSMLIFDPWVIYSADDWRLAIFSVVRTLFMPLRGIPEYGIDTIGSGAEILAYLRNNRFVNPTYNAFVTNLLNFFTYGIFDQRPTSLTGIPRVAAARATYVVYNSGLRVEREVTPNLRLLNNMLIPLAGLQRVINSFPNRLKNGDQQYVTGILKVVSHFLREAEVITSHFSRAYMNMLRVEGTLPATSIHTGIEFLDEHNLYVRRVVPNALLSRMIVVDWSSIPRTLTVASEGGNSKVDIAIYTDQWSWMNDSYDSVLRIAAIDELINAVEDVMDVRHKLSNSERVRFMKENGATFTDSDETMKFVRDFHAITGAPDRIRDTLRLYFIRFRHMFGLGTKLVLKPVSLGFNDYYAREFALSLNPPFVLAIPPGPVTNRQFNQIQSYTVRNAENQARFVNSNLVLNVVHVIRRGGDKALISWEAVHDKLRELIPVIDTFGIQMDGDEKESYESIIRSQIPLLVTGHSVIFSADVQSIVATTAYMANVNVEFYKKQLVRYEDLSGFLI
jgi:hypothetical protein